MILQGAGRGPGHVQNFQVLGMHDHVVPADHVRGLAMEILQDVRLAEAHELNGAAKLYQPPAELYPGPPLPFRASRSASAFLLAALHLRSASL